jgi:hypothetical protein
MLVDDRRRIRCFNIPFPLTVTGVMARFWTAAVGVAAAEAARTAAMAKVFMMVVCELMIITVGD